MSTGEPQAWRKWLLESVAVARSDSGPRSHVAVTHSRGPPAFRTVWAKSFCAKLGIFLRQLSFSSLVSAKVPFPRSSSSPSTLGSLPVFRSASETLRTCPPGFSLLLVLARVLFPRFSSSFSISGSPLASRSALETPQTPRLAFSSLWLSVMATAKAFSSSCAVKFLASVSDWAFPPLLREPSEFAPVSLHRFVAPEGQSRQ